MEEQAGPKVKHRRTATRTRETATDEVDSKKPRSTAATRQLSTIDEEPASPTPSGDGDAEMIDASTAQDSEKRGFAEDDFVDYENEMEVAKLELKIKLIEAKQKREESRKKSGAGPSRFRGSMHE